MYALNAVNIVKSSGNTLPFLFSKASLLLTSSETSGTGTTVLDVSNALGGSGHAGFQSESIRSGF